MHSDLEFIEVPKNRITASPTDDVKVQWARLVPVMFDGRPLISHGREKGDLYVITGENLPRLEQMDVEGVFRKTYAQLSEKKIFLAGIILTTRASQRSE